MIATESSAAAHPTRGIVLMVLAMLSIPIVDGLAKHLSAGYSPLFISWARYAVAAVIVLPLAASIHGRRLFPAERRAAHILRTVFLVTAMTLYFFAVARIPLVTALSASLVSPIIAMALSVLVLGERVTTRKVASLALSIVGSLVILRPGGSTDPGILLALGTGVFFALYMIATRHAALESDPIKTLAFQCAAGMALLTPQATIAWSIPAWSDLPAFVGLGAFSAISHLLSISAFRYADASTLAPLVYVELVGASIIGYLAFREIPGAPTTVGAACIVIAGLILVRTRSTRTS